MSNTKESIVLKYDDMGIPSIMLKVENTAKTPEEADRMFFVRGVEYDSIYLSQFVNCIRNGRLRRFNPGTERTVRKLLCHAHEQPGNEYKNNHVAEIGSLRERI